MYTHIVVKKKIMLCSPPIEAAGGIASWAKNILEFYHNSYNGSDLDMEFFPMERKKFIRPSTHILVRVISGIKDYSSIIKKFKETVKQVKPDIVHISSSGSLGLLKDLFIQRYLVRYNKKKLNKIRIIVHFHFGRIPELKKKRNWEWLLLSCIVTNADTIIVMDSKSLDTLQMSGHANVKLVSNPISDELVQLIKRNSNVFRIPRKIVFAGHIVPTKGVFELVKACMQIPNVQLTMMGISEAEIETQLLELAKNKGENEWLHIITNQRQSVVIQEMLSSEVFVLPSYTEGFPNVILESMACACSIVASSVGAIPEMLDSESENPGGICIPPRNVDRLREALVIMLNEKGFAGRCAKNAHTKVMEKYSSKIIWKSLLNIWLEC